ncbi:MAG: GNAT family N-acetyltransferase [bacterium]|nr:GNAT family N-acetyltransferase [bacterium]
MTGLAFLPPTLTTERLILEPLSIAHSAGMFSMWRDPEVCRFSGPANDVEGRPIRLPAICANDSDKIIEFFLQGLAEGRGFRWALISRAEGQFVGTAGFNSLGACSEYAYHLHPDFWGRGLAREASNAAIGWLWTRDGSVEVEAFIDTDNWRSVRLATDLGFGPSGQNIDGAARHVLAAPLGWSRPALDLSPPQA